MCCFSTLVTTIHRRITQLLVRRYLLPFAYQLPEGGIRYDIRQPVKVIRFDMIAYQLDNLYPG